MAANDFAAQNGTEKLATNLLSTVNGTSVVADNIEAPRVKVGFGSDGAYRDVDAANGLPIVVVNNSLVSTANSTAVNLGISGVFTGTSEDVSEYSAIMVSIFADQASAVDGLSIQQSSNGTNWDVTDVYSIPISTGKVFSVGVVARFFRVVYTNGATATTALRLQTLFSKSAKKNSSHRPLDGRTNDNDFEEALSHLMGFNGVSFDRLRSTIANGLAVDVTRLTAVPEMRAATLHVTATAAVNTAITATLPAPAAGLFHYITSVQLVKLYGALGVASGAGVVITSSNLPGSPAWLTEQAAGAVGTLVRVIDYQPTTPLKASLAATATTFVAPAQLQTIWRWNISYFTAA